MTETPSAASGPAPFRAPPQPPLALALVIGPLLVAIIALNLLHGFGLGDGTARLADLCSIAVLALFAPWVRGSRHVFLAISLALAGYCLIALPAPGPVLWRALDSASFIIAFYCALASLQHVAGRSTAITRAAAFLANQPPGRRYLALGTGVQVFALMLNYGALSLLGTMGKRAAEAEREPAVRALRTRRMLQAAQCGFAASLCWSPLAFATVITTGLVPGATLGTVMGHGLGSALIIVLIGWLVDRRLKHSLPQGTVVAPPDPQKARDVRALWPLLWLLLGVAIPAIAIDALLGVQPSRSVLGLVPLVAGLWIAVEARPGTRARVLGERLRAFVFGDLPSFQSELTLLATAGFIGTAAGALLAHGFAAAGTDLGAVPPRVLLALPLILVPIAGQLGLNPILFVSLFAQLLPSPAEMGIAPVAMVLALTGGWALCAPTSPFTASVMIISRLAGIAPREVAFKWNGVFVALSILALGLWVQILA